MILADSLVKTFAGKAAVDHVSFEVRQGEVLGFLGPNGAGKSTTMRMIAGCLEPDGGRATVAGFDSAMQRRQAQTQLGYLPEGAPAYPAMTARSFVRFCLRARGFSGVDLDQAAERALNRANLGEAAEKAIGTLSKGYKRRAALAAAIAHDPPVLILDEPTDGLDPNQKDGVRALITAMAPDKAIIISTHLLDEVEAICTRAIIIADGRILADGTPAALAAQSPDGDIRSAFRDLTSLSGEAISQPAPQARAMTGLNAIYRRELAAYFQTPLAWVFLTVFAIAAPSLTWQTGRLFETGRADLAPLFDYLPWLLLVLMPALAMRAWAEERDRGTLETLLASPVALWEVAAGKFLAAWTVAALALALTFPLWIAINWLGSPDNAATATAYFGALLLAGGYLAIGQALSATTTNQVIAFVLGAAACLLITLAGLPLVLDAMSAWLPGAAAEALAELSALSRFESLRRGVISLPDIAYFLSLIVLGLACAMTLIDARRGGGR